MIDYRKYFLTYKFQLANLKKLDLLKKIEAITAEIFTTSEEYASFRSILGEDNIDLVLNAALKSHFEGVEEYSRNFFNLLSIGSQRQEITRKFVQIALEELNHGFEEFDAILIKHAAQISSLYDQYYLKWLKAVRTSEDAQRLQELLNNDSESLNTTIEKQQLNNHYTIITVDNNKNLSHYSYSDFFSTEIEAICYQFDQLILELNQLSNLTETNLITIEFLKQYRKALSTKEIDQLEIEWTKLDELWVKDKYWIQIVHDMEYGYGDPLRTKVIPDFSLRFIDTSFYKENEQIEAIRKLMVDYFSRRDSDLAKQSTNALKNSFAAIYYLPFQCGMSLHFRFAGQSIPNRSQIRNNMGVKIYFDPVSTASRVEKVKKLTKKVFADPTVPDKIDTIDSIVNHIAAHEFGHAAYGLDNVRSVISIATKSLLEEPRAELTTLTFLKVMNETGMLSDEKLSDSLLNFAGSDLRRFVNFESEPTRPYTISAINTYKKYFELGYFTLLENKILIDKNKTKLVLQAFTEQFEKLLAAEDNLNGRTIELELTQMQTHTKEIDWLRDLFSS